MGVVILHRTMPGLVVAEGVSSQVQQEIYDAVAQETKELEDEINFVSVYPVATLGLSYQF